jgi:hypothetical protein
MAHLMKEPNARQGAVAPFASQEDENARGAAGRTLPDNCAQLMGLASQEFWARKVEALSMVAQKSGPG